MSSDGDAGDALAVDVAGHHARVEGDRGEDRALRRGVESLDVGGRVGLGVPEALGLGERLVERRTVLAHLREDVVRGAVHDAEHAAHAFAGERFLQRSDQRDTARDRGFEQQVEAGGVGGVEEVLALAGEELLVGGDHRLPVRERPEQQDPGGLDPAHHLADDVDLGVVDDGDPVGGEDIGGQRHVTVPARIAHGHPRHGEPAARPHRDVVGVLVQQPDRRGADGAAPQHADADRAFAHASSPGLRSSAEPSPRPPIQAAISISSSSP